MPKVAKNGRVTVPKRVRDYLGLAIGTEVIFRRSSDESVIIERAEVHGRLVDSPNLSGAPVRVRLRTNSWRYSAATDQPPR